MINRLLWWFIGAVAGLALLLVLTLALPVPSWRTGRLSAPALELVEGGPMVPRTRRVWIDTDAACGATPATDPDDCLAIAWLVQQDLEIAGISTSFGNAPADTVHATSRALIDRLSAGGRTPPALWRGASAPLGTTVRAQAPAHQALRDALAQGPLAILVLGPLTNIAAALAERPDMQRNIVRLVAVMGHRPGHIFHPSEGSGQGRLLGHGPIFRDLNFAKDPEAARAALSMGLPVTLIPYDAARHVRIGEDDLDRLARAGPGLAWAARRSRGWLEHWRTDIGQPGFYPFDWVAAVYLVAPQLFRCARVPAWIDEELAFWLLPRPGLLVGPEAPTGQEPIAKVLYCPEVDRALGEVMAGR